MTAEKTSKNLRREDLHGRPLKAQTYEILVTTHEKIRDRSKEFKVTAPELLEVLMDNTDWDAMAPLLEAVRARKEEVRAKNLQAKRAASADPKALDLAKKLQGLSPDKLAEVEAVLAAVRS